MAVAVAAVAEERHGAVEECELCEAPGMTGLTAEALSQLEQAQAQTPALSSRGTVDLLILLPPHTIHSLFCSELPIALQRRNKAAACLG